MSLQQRIWDTVPPSGVSPPALYAAMAPATAASIDAALGGLLRAQRVCRVMGVLQPGPNKSPIPDSIVPVGQPKVEVVVSVKQAGGIERSVDGLREMLFDEIEKLRSGEIDAKRAKATAGLAMTLIKSVEIQIAYQRDVEAKKLPAALPDMPLALRGRQRA